MKYHNHFKKQNYLSHIKTEFSKHKKSLKFPDYLILPQQLTIIGTWNYFIKRKWLAIHNLIKNRTEVFYLDVNILIEKPDLTFWEVRNKQLQNFNFNKAHIAITSYSLHFFPYNINSKYQLRLLNTLYEPFSIVYGEIKYDKRNSMNRILLNSIVYTKNGCTLEIRIENISHPIVLSVNRKLSINNI